ncbi:MAG: OB-fold nucleic acid binding domain-containing protein, partial [Actinomycetota bacterium]
GKKNRAIMAAEEPRFIDGCVKTGLDETEARKLWALLQPFADYSFNRAHSACYAYIAYQTAWLKAHYPIEYMAALLTSVKDSKDGKPKYLHIARRMGIPVLVPDVNSSERDFAPVDDSIRFGLSAVRGIGEGVVEKITEARRRKGTFVSFHDFCRKVDYICLNRKTVESLIKAGAFDSLDSPGRPHTRKGLLENFESISADVVARRKHEENGQFSLFAGAAADGNGSGAVGDPEEHPIPLEEFSKDVLLAHEKEVLGLFVSDHPLLGVERLLARMTDGSLASLQDRSAGEAVTVGGMVAGLRKRVTRRGEVMVLMDFEDLSGAGLEVIVFPKVHTQYLSILRPDAILLIKGRVDRDARDDSLKLIAMEIHEPKLGTQTPVEINLPADSCTEGVIDQLKDVLASHPGTTQVFLHLVRGSDRTVLRLGSEFWVDTGNGLHAELKALLGPAALT